MCTLIVQWNPGADKPLVVGANRDERPERESEAFAFRNGILCPLDVRGGTWIGVNNQRVFVALTNLDRTEPSQRGRHSRGLLVLKALERGTTEDAVSAVVDMMMQNIYNAFNLLIASQKRMVAIVGHGASRKLELLHFGPGLHVATGWGVDNWKNPRARWVKDYFEHNSPSCDMKQALSYHSPDAQAKSSVCVHDPNESHVTVSSCIIEVTNAPQAMDKSDRKWRIITVQHVEVPPCTDVPWNKATMYCEG
jgi:hypothetical protein